MAVDGCGSNMMIATRQHTDSVWSGGVISGVEEETMGRRDKEEEQ